MQDSGSNDWMVLYFALINSLRVAAGALTNTSQLKEQEIKKVKGILQSILH